MVIAIIGENCTGKSTIADLLRKKLNAQIFTGNDYMRLAKDEYTAKTLFAQKLKDALSGEHIIYVASKKEQLELLPDGAIRVLTTADLDTITERFAKRMNGTLPPPVRLMLERSHGQFDSIMRNVTIKSEDADLDEAVEQILALIKS